jgi:hypothetical protein
VELVELGNGGLPRAIPQGSDNDGQQHLQRLAVRSPVARQLSSSTLARPRDVGIELSHKIRRSETLNSDAGKPRFAADSPLERRGFEPSVWQSLPKGPTTGSLLTPCWRKGDSNCRSRLETAIPGLAFFGFLACGSAGPEGAQLPGRTEPGKSTASSTACGTSDLPSKSPLWRRRSNVHNNLQQP